jgi:hypothetical protein
MNRKLLPYERGLCEQLGLSEEDYLLFLAAQRDYTLSGAQRLETLRGEPVSIILTVVGILFQVAAALLAPKPEKPKAQKQLRARVYAPRYGFNSTQELASYGDPVNLVYCNENINPVGGVRVNTALLWSSVESTGTGQYMQTLVLVGASQVKGINWGKTAFGQLPVRQFGINNAWIYYADTNGPVRFSQKQWGDQRDPAADGQASNAIVHMVEDRTGKREGYSMAFTPTTATELGVYAPIPINVKVFERDPQGDIEEAPIQIILREGGFQQTYNVGDTFKLVFHRASRETKDNGAIEAAKDLREQLVNNLDKGAIYMLGSAHFKLLRFEEGDDLFKENISGVFECTEPGLRPSTAYDRMVPKKLENYDREMFDHYYRVLTAPATEDTVDLTTYDMVLAGATAQATQTRKGYLGLTAEQIAKRKWKNSLVVDNIYINGLGRTYDFNGYITVDWIDDLDKPQTRTIHQGGSLAYSEKILEQFLADKPKILTKLLRREYQSDLKKLRKYRDDLRAGRYKRQLRNDIKHNDPTVNAVFVQIQNLNNLIAAANGEDMDEVWRAEARGQAHAVSLRDQIRAKREEIESYADNEAGGRAVKKVKRLENQIENLRDDRRDFISDYVGRKRRESKKDKSQINAWRNQKDNLRTEMRELIDDRMDDWRTEKVREAREATYAFYGYDGNRYACGVNCLVDKIEDLKGEWTTDQVGTNLIRQKLRELIQQKQEAIQWLRWVTKNWETLARDADDHFYSKCLVKSAKVNYQTITKCDIVRFNFRARLFRTISGRAMEYGEKEAPDGYKLSDNGTHKRVMFFFMMYRRLGDAIWTIVPYVFAIERGNDADHYVSLLFSGSEKVKREFRFVPIVDANAHIKEHGAIKYIYINNGGQGLRTIQVGSDVIRFYGKFVDIDTNNLPAMRERGPMYTNEWDMFSVHSDTQVQASYDSGPEAKLVNVTEQVSCTLDPQKYQGMSLMAFNTYASNGVEDLRSLSAYVTEGKASWKVRDTDGVPYQSGEGSCYAPDIFADTVMDQANGIKNFANSNAIDWQQLAAAKRFCKNNNLGCRLHMDGVIADRRGWRDFWVEVAPYSLLEFARLNGKETLIPAVPTTPDGQATTNVTISGLFNEGNILEDSYREEFLDYGDNTKDLVATVVYREMVANEVFPRNNSVTLCRADTDTSDAVWQTFDLSDWVSQKRQAELFGRYLCQQRRHVGRSIEFRTIPTDTPVAPGAYIYVDIGLKRWDSVRTGVIKAGGVLDLPLEVGIADGTYTVMTYNSERLPEVHTGIQVVGGVAVDLAAAEGSLFVLGSTADSRRVFRVTDVSLNEEGEVTVRGVEHPCAINGATATSLVADLSDGLFKEIGVDCG